jgi:trans-2,3-dihydro-3-hydroxyanthranilate isomerase
MATTVVRRQSDDRTGANRSGCPSNSKALPFGEQIMNAPNAYRYLVVDVFTEHPLEGNALAVFPHASNMDDGLMQKIARELNLAETTFVVPATRADCTVSVRIFTPLREMIFAGHPTIGTAFVLMEEGMVPEKSEHFVLEEKVGPVPIRVERGQRPLIWLRTPPIHYGKIYDRALCAEMLGLEPKNLLDVNPQFVSAGNPTVFIPVADKPSVDRALLDMRGLKIIKGSDDEPFCVFVFTPTSDGAYSRMFAPEYGVIEDPATGSSTGPLASFMMRHGLVSGVAGNRFVSEQGTKMGRRSLLYVHIVGQDGIDGIDVGGYVTPVAEATMRLGGHH